MTNNRSRRFGVSESLMAIALLAAQPAVAASTLTFTGFEYGSASVGINTDPIASAAVSSDQAGAYLTKIDSGPTFESFCIDVWQYLSFNHTPAYVIGTDYTYKSPAQMVNYVPHAGSPLMTSTVLGNLSRLYDEATTLGYHTATGSAALQLGVWEIAFEGTNAYDLTTGNFKSAPSSTVTTQTTTWLNGLAGYSATKYLVNGYVSATNQDVIFFTPVPEPGTYAMMLAGLGLMGFVARRRSRRANG